MGVKELTAADLMTKELVTIAPHETLRAAATLMAARHLHCLLVPGEPGHLVGVITSKDIVLVLCDGEPELLDQLRVEDAQSTPAVSVQHDFLIADCIRQ